MAVPFRGATFERETYFITANCEQKKQLLQSQRMASLLVDVFLHYRKERKYLLHEFVVMPNHFHALLTTVNQVTLEKAVQFIKGGFSYRAKKELRVQWEIWQNSFVDRRVRDAAEYGAFRDYILENPVKAGLCSTRVDWPYSSANLQLDDVPQRLKPKAFTQASTSQT